MPSPRAWPTNKDRGAYNLACIGERPYAYDPALTPASAEHVPLASTQPTSPSWPAYPPHPLVFPSESTRTSVTHCRWLIRVCGPRGQGHNCLKAARSDHDLVRMLFKRQSPRPRPLLRVAPSALVTLSLWQWCPSAPVTLSPVQRQSLSVSKPRSLRPWAPS